MNNAKNIAISVNGISFTDASLNSEMAINVSLQPDGNVGVFIRNEMVGGVAVCLPPGLALRFAHLLELCVHAPEALCPPMD